jgi:hypothetical protein
MAADNNVAFERLELLGRLVDKEEEMRSKQIAVGIAQQAMLTAILELLPDRQVTALRVYTTDGKNHFSKIFSDCSGG